MEAAATKLQTFSVQRTGKEYLLHGLKSPGTFNESQTFDRDYLLINEVRFDINIYIIIRMSKYSQPSNDLLGHIGP